MNLALSSAVATLVGNQHLALAGNYSDFAARRRGVKRSFSPSTHDVKPLDRSFSQLFPSAFRAISTTPPLLPPSARLVGIELNPGPPKRSKASSVTVSVVPAAPRLQRTRRRARRRDPIRGAPLSADAARRGAQRPVDATISNYLRTLRDPWFCPPVKLGFGTFVPSSVHSSWRNFAYTFPAADTCFAIVGTPAVGTPISLRPGYLSLYSAVDPSSTLAAAASTKGYLAATNAAGFATVCDTARVISGALRVTVRYAATALRGTLHVMYVGDDSTTAMISNSYNNLSDKFTSRRCKADTAGEIGGEVQYRPVDANSFVMDNRYCLEASTFTATDNLPQLLVVGTGWSPGTYSVEISQIFHYETLAGLDQNATDTDTNSLAANGHTMDVLAAALPSLGEPVLTSIGAEEAVEMAFSGFAHASRMSRGSYRGNVQNGASAGGWFSS